MPVFSSRRVDHHMGAALEGKKELGEEKEKAPFHPPTFQFHCCFLPAAKSSGPRTVRVVPLVVEGNSFILTFG